MANHKSALKRVRQTAKRNVRNRAIRSETRTSVSKAKQLITENAGKEAVAKSVSAAASTLAVAARKGAIHWKTAARKTSRLQKAANKASA